ncbi:30S ribosomal protein S16 [Engelhardtia mirabilis]|uniref:Small ribosomal subunit protein bS16 n=1 Tax=Engelhardtia mirabilis TaxID=2528011 RepID=A0A518BLY0_9BACT|nr:30S ribosomal protein S16 [Planctomycetes bacterium Pla133]QDV02283.1 30S ribosomal protein S16 [Planctomycetes bacterium Pla86]
MAVVIRMKRTGRKNAPCYRISVADSRNPRDGRTLETLGIYDPISPVEDLRLRLDVERARFWLDRGAKPSHTVNNLFVRENVYEGKVEKPKRERPGRAKDTKKRANRAQRKASFAAAKSARRDERAAARKAAKAAAGAAE